jgi:uncharacterized protein (TIGR00251 family)
MNNFKFHNSKAGSAIHIRVQPKSSKNEISEILDDGTIKIRLTAPAYEGKANQALIKFLSDLIGVPPSDIEIVAGQKNKDKLVTITNIQSTQIEKLIHNSIEK